MVISIHGGNELFICPAIHEFRDETGKPMLYVNPYKTFAPDLDLACFANADNSTKETALLRAALTILNKPAILGCPDPRSGLLLRSSALAAGSTDAFAGTRLDTVLL